MRFGVSKAIIYSTDTIDEILPLAVMEITKDLIRNAHKETGTDIDYTTLKISTRKTIIPVGGSLFVEGTLENRPRPYTEEEKVESVIGIWNEIQETGEVRK